MGMKFLGEFVRYVDGRDQLFPVLSLVKSGWDSLPENPTVSLSSANIGELGRVPYVACEKSDGVRYLLFAASGLVFLINRKENGMMVSKINFSSSNSRDSFAYRTTSPRRLRYPAFIYKKTPSHPPRRGTRSRSIQRRN